MRGQEVRGANQTQQALRKVSVRVDAWSFRMNPGCMIVTGQWIDHGWTMRSMFL